MRLLWLCLMVIALEAKPHGLEPLSDATLATLTPTQQLNVAHKLLFTLYKSQPLSTTKQLLAQKKFLATMRETVHEKRPQPLTQFIKRDTLPIIHDGRDPLHAKYASIIQEIHSELYFTALDAHYFTLWTSYTLMQTILFSSSSEVDSVYPFPEMILTKYRALNRQIEAHQTIAQIVNAHMKSVQNWARFRSPEDNAREMLEIWLHDYEDADVPLGAQALSHCFFKVRYGHITRYDFSCSAKATNAVVLRGKTLKSADDFFSMIVRDKNFLPTLSLRLINYFFPEMSQKNREALHKELVKMQPKTFTQLFEIILFSQAYLLDNSRYKRFEELLFPLLQTLHFKLDDPRNRRFIFMRLKGLNASNQPAFAYKLGRPDAVPTDSVSLNAVQQYVRNIMLFNAQPAKLMKKYPIAHNGWDIDAFCEREKKLEREDYISHLLELFIARPLLKQERLTIDALFSEQYPFVYCKELTLATLDYLSYLEEFYRFTKVTHD